MRTIVTIPFVLAALCLLTAGPAFPQNGTQEAPRRDNYMGTFSGSDSMIMESGPGQDNVIQVRPQPQEEEDNSQEPPMLIVPEVRVPRIRR